MARAPKPPKSPALESQDRLKKWARATDFAQPLPWAELEARTVADPMPPRAELEEFFPPSTRSRFLPYLLAVPVALVTSGASLVGLGLVVAHVFGELDSTGAAEITRFFFLAAIIITAVPVMMWFSTRRRGTFQLLLSAGTAVVAAITCVLLSLDPEVGGWGQVRTMAAIAVVTGLGSAVFLRVFGKPGVQLTWRERMATPTLEEQWVQSQRGVVLEALAKKGLVNRWDVPELRSLPPDTWRQLESQPDGHVVRRHR